MQQTAPALQQTGNQKPRPQWWPKGTSGNPTGIRISQHAMALFYEIAAELGGVDALSIIDRTMLSQACRLLVRSQRLKDVDAAIRMSSEARRTLQGLRKRVDPPKVPSLDQHLAEAEAKAEEERVAADEAAP